MVSLPRNGIKTAMEKELNAPVLCAAWAKNGHIICGGGGGNRHIGAANFLVVLNFDADSLRLSDPLYTFDTDDEVPNILAVHPNGTDFMCSFIANRRQTDFSRLYVVVLLILYRHDGKLEILRLFCDEEEGKRIEIAADREQLQALKHVNEQSALKFSRDGSFLAMGGKLVLDKPHKADKGISDLDFRDNSCLAVTVDGRACELWDLTKRSQISTIPLPGATFGRFSPGDTNLLHLVAQGSVPDLLAAIFAIAATAGIGALCVYLHQ
ncbi:uncharacterized protein LOC112346968 [Selaginella moellendorffii]|uniref:uncharacterized protein LOC112346968 n=1 Tax=Selaginella moellendorffii TaxID=88036 RepID=UPI000D1CCBB6|nr:uncharacterized protein LOC112346968 [Selaginella moellendorffii]|eukprot:XP_024532783.1 uncharacterized protein LOC112346968 [Selaginella moellendorffii]